MEVANTIARYLLGIMFAVFGLNGFLHFIPQPPPTSPLAIHYMTAVAGSHYFVLVFLIQIVSGVLLLLNRFLPLALTLLAPLIVNILLFHALMDPSGLLPGVVALILWLLVFIRVRGSFAGLFDATPREWDVR